MLYGQAPKWVDRLERHLPGLGIPNLAIYLVGAQAIGFLLALYDPMHVVQLLALIPELVLRGELWRLVSFLAVPLFPSLFWTIFGLYFLYFILNGIEEEWGEFRTTLYVLVAVILSIAFSFAFNVPIRSAKELTSTFFFAAATIAPEYQILLFFVLPVKLKWLAWLSAAFIAWELIAGAWLDRLYLLTMYANYLLFFGPYFVGRLKAFYRREKFKRDLQAGRESDDNARE